MYNGETIHIIGGGAAGLMAAVSAAEAGARVVILEKTDRPGRKLAITGKGRCNITTGNDLETALNEFGRNGKFLRSAFSRFFAADLLEMFHAMGVPTAMERGKRYFPQSGRASDIVKALENRLNALGVEVAPRSRVREITVASGGVSGVVTEDSRIEARRVILATGGASYPATGSTGDGYAIAAALGHTIIKPTPALVPLDLAGKIPGELDALPLKNVTLRLTKDGETLREEFGEAMFTHWGITGPAALALGKTAALNAGRGLGLSVDFKPALTAEQVDKRLQREFAAGGGRHIETILRGLLPHRAAQTLGALSGVSSERRGAEISRAEREKLVRLLKSLNFRVKGTRPLEEAIVTAGGVALDEVSPKIMESKLVKGLYICGELLDVDAGTGGYNLQAAFSTGFVAGAAAAG